MQQLPVQQQNIQSSVSVDFPTHSRYEHQLPMGN